MTDSSPEALPVAPPAQPAPAPVALPSIHPWLVDPRLSRAQQLGAERDWQGAAQAMAEAEAALSPDARSAPERCAWAYESGRFLAAAGRFAEAAIAFDRAIPAARAPDDAGPPCPLAGFAALHAADAYLRAGDPILAADRARVVPADVSVHDDAALVLANALAAQGKAEDAIPLWRDAIAHNPKAWIDVALPLASALLDGPERDDDARARANEALALATRVVVDAPRIADSSGAEALRHRAWTRAAARKPGVALDLTPAQRAEQAKAWLDGGESTKAARLAGALLADPSAGGDRAAACSAAVVRAQALAHTRAGVGSAWDDAIARCEGEPLLVTALYSGAKAAQAKHPELARERFARVEAQFRDHRLADDARFLGALVALGQGDEASFTRMMLTLPDDYPAGDQRAEALFRVALLRMTRGDWAGAAPLLDRILELTPDDRHWATAGRAAYFRAPAAAELGHRDEARAGYARVIASHPLAYYMTQAYARLSEDDVALGARALSAALASSDAAPFLSRTHVEFESAPWARALQLLEVGDIDVARRELALAGATKDDADSEVTWVVALLYDRAGAPELGHAFARQKLHDYLAHYPVGAWRTKWEIAYPRAFESLVLSSSKANGVPSSLTWAIMREESDFIADAKSGSSAYGLMQLIVPTARGVAVGLGLPSDEASLRLPRVSVALGTRLLAQLRASFADQRPLAITAYNGGGGAVSRWLAQRAGETFDTWVEEIPWEETRGYEKRVLSSQAAYAFLYDPATLDEVLRIAPRVRGAEAPREGVRPR